MSTLVNLLLALVLNLLGLEHHEHQPHTASMNDTVIMTEISKTSCDQTNLPTDSTFWIGKEQPTMRGL